MNMNIVSLTACDCCNRDFLWQRQRLIWKGAFMTCCATACHRASCVQADITGSVSAIQRFALLQIGTSATRHDLS